VTEATAGRRLTSTERKHLRGLAHSLSPVVHVGRQGLTAAVIEATRRALDEHELIKVKMAADRDERERIALDLQERCDAVLAGTIGTIAILYRQHPDPERRRIAIPARAPAP